MEYKNLSAGCLVVTDKGSLVMLDSPTMHVDDSSGQLKQYYSGVVLNGLGGTGAKWRGLCFRVLPQHINEFVVRLSHEADITTPAEPPRSTLSLEDRLELLEKENAELRSARK
jgi:hypothetical protein